PGDRWAAIDLAQKRVFPALSHYATQGHLHQHPNHSTTVEATLKAWEIGHGAMPEQSHIMLAGNAEDVRALNDAARALRHTAGELGPAFTVQTSSGDREFAPGDRVCFLRDDRDLGVKDGTLGTVEALHSTHMHVRLDAGPDEQTASRHVACDLAVYTELEHGYAATLHRAQGLTADHAYIVASRDFDAHTTYVAFTRHTQSAELHYSATEFATQDRLCDALGQERARDITVDYADVVQRNEDLARQAQVQEAEMAAEHEARGRDAERHASQQADFQREHDAHLRQAAETARSDDRTDAWAHPTHQTDLYTRQDDRNPTATLGDPNALYDACQARVHAYEKIQGELAWRQAIPERTSVTEADVWKNLHQVAAARRELHDSQAVVRAAEAAITQQIEKEVDYQMQHA
ncbi:MAG: hypothetical protein EOO40_09570, partial [Deltaproteobacteria bacterium]